MSKNINYFTLLGFSLSLLLTGCAGTEVDPLEKPPRLVDFSTYNETYPGHTQGDEVGADDEDIFDEGEKRINFDVLLSSQDGRNTTVTIVKPYEKVWPRVAKALQHPAFDVSDLNRDAGKFFVSYDPDYQLSGWDKTVSFFSGGSGAVSDFELQLTDVDTITEINAELVEDSLDDSYEDADTEVENFLLMLYKVLREQ